MSHNMTSGKKIWKLKPSAVPPSGIRSQWKLKAVGFLGLTLATAGLVTFLCRMWDIPSSHRQLSDEPQLDVEVLVQAPENATTAIPNESEVLSKEAETQLPKEVETKKRSGGDLSGVPARFCTPEAIAKSKLARSFPGLKNKDGDYVTFTCLMLYVRDQDGILMLRVQDYLNAKNPKSWYYDYPGMIGRWMYPGGGVDHLDANLDAGAVREFLEETGIKEFPKVENVRYVDYSEGRGRDNHNRKKKCKRVVRMYYAVTETLGDPLKTLAVDDKEVSGWQFVNADSVEKWPITKRDGKKTPAYGFITKYGGFEHFKPSNTRSWDFLFQSADSAELSQPEEVELPGLGKTRPRVEWESYEWEDGSELTENWNKWFQGATVKKIPEDSFWHGKRKEVVDKHVLVSNLPETLEPIESSTPVEDR